MATKPVELLIGEGLKVEWFNDDVLGRTLDKLYSKDGRPDLKQFVISLVMSDSLPVFIRALSGNTSAQSRL
jgi:transposase